MSKTPITDALYNRCASSDEWCKSHAYLEQELAKARKNERRYLWLRTKMVRYRDTNCWFVGPPLTAHADQQDGPHGAEFDAAVDLASGAGEGVSHERTR